MLKDKLFYLQSLISYAPPAPVAAPPTGGSGGLGVLGGLGGVFVCLFCLATLGLLGLLAAFIATTVFLGKILLWIWKCNFSKFHPFNFFVDGVADALDDVNGNGGSAVYVNMALLLAVLCFAGFRKLQRSL